MAGEAVRRRLAAILAADVTGYSWLMGSDEVRTVRDLKAHQAVLLPMVPEFGGRIIDTAGDGILAEFASAVQAVECAVAIQRVMTERNAAVDQTRRMQLRIGVNIGDLIWDETRVYGDGINVAARLEGIAEPGGVCVSEDAYRQARGKVDVTFADMGEQSLKNIARQVRAYKIVLDGSSTMAASELPLPSKPSIAILPFQNMSDDLEQEYFADGLAEDIITTLSHSQSLFVIARNSSFSYKGRAVDVKQIARELGVRYLLEGSVRRAGNRVRITAQLIEAVTGNHLWAERYDRDLVDIFAVQDEITEAVATAIEPAVSQTERHRAVHKPPENLGAWEAYQRGLWHMNRGSVTDNQSAQSFFRRAIELDSSFASAHAELTLAIFSAASTYQTMSIAEALDEAVPIADKAIALDPLSAAGYVSKSSARIYQGDHQGALDAAREALTISPNYAAAHHFLGVAFLFSGRPREALEPIRRAIRLDPHNPLQINRLCHIAIAYYFLREYETATAAARAALRSYPDHPLAYRWFAAALGQAGRLDEAKQALTALTPKSIDMFVRHRAPWYRVEDYQHMLEGLRKAGWKGSEGLALDAIVRLGEQELEAGNHEHALRAANKALAVNNMREDAHRLIVQAPAGDMSEDPEQTVKAKSIEARSDALSPAVAARSASPERRQLTIMVCTMVVSSPLRGDLDPEEMSQQIALFHKVVADVAARFGGFVVAQRLADGVHVYFGYPAAHEHDAEQAIRAGLALLDAVGMLEASSGVTFRARAGIATGLVVVGEQLGTGNAQRHIAIGDAPNLAARLQAVAAPGEVVIAASTRRLVGGMFDCHALGTGELEGLPPSVEAWRVRGETVGVSRFAARHAGALSPLVGRQEEMELLLRRWHQAKAGEGRVVLLSGEPGIGKSRIAETLLTRLEGEPHAAVRYFCSPHHTHSPLYPFIAQLEQAASFEAGSSAREKLDKLQALLKPTARNLLQDLALIAELLAVPLDERYPVVEVTPQQKREMALNALLYQLEGLASQGPVLIAFEDAHWIDPTSLDLLDRTVAHVAKLPVLMAVTFRPEFQPTWVGQPHVTMLPLSRLGRGDSASMLSGLTKGKALPDTVAQHILAHTDGVPLFIEELTSMLLESGFLRETGDCYALDGPLPPLAIPTTLQASLMARLDRLASVKDVAQIGAAIGREFSYELIAPVSALPPRELEAALEQLAAAGLISRRGAPPVATYSFKHALVQDAAYASLVRSRRHRLHATVARVLEERFPALAQAQPELVAHHYTSAGLYRQSISYWLKAGQLANDRSANSEAASHLSRGLELLATLPSSRERDNRELDLLLALGRALIIAKGYADPEVERVYSRAQALSPEVSDPAQRFAVVRGLWTFRLAKGEVETARHLATELLHLTEEQQLARLRSAANLSLGQTAVHLGSFVDAHGYFERAIEQTKATPPRRRPTQDALVTCYCYDAQALWHLGRLQATVRRIEDAIARANELTTPYNLAFAFFHAACIHRYLGDKAGARRWALQSIALSEEHSFPYLRAFAMQLRGWSGGVTEAEEALAAFRQIGAGLWGVEVLAILAEVYADAERSTEALKHLEASLAEGRRTGERWREAEVHRLLGELLLRMSPAAHHEAEESFSQALQVAREQHAKSLELRAALSLSRLWCRLDKRADAHHLLAGVYGYFTEDFDTADLRDAKAFLGELSHT